MENPGIEKQASELIRQWVGEVAQLQEGVEIEVREEPHCPDPSCPLKRTVVEWTEVAGKKRRAVVVKPLAYVRQGDVERAVRKGWGGLSSFAPSPSSGGTPTVLSDLSSGSSLLDRSATPKTELPPPTH